MLVPGRENGGLNRRLLEKVLEGVKFTIINEHETVCPRCIEEGKDYTFTVDGGWGDFSFHQKAFSFHQKALVIMTTTPEVHAQIERVVNKDIAD